MKKLNIENIGRFFFLFMGLSAILTFSACDKEDDDVDDPVVNDPIASFQFEVDAEDFLKVTFTNYSQNATSYAWDFGDGETSTEKDPVHTYAEAGDYTIELTATNSEGKTATFSETIELTDPNSALRVLADDGNGTKVWKLFREGTSMWMDPYWDGLMNDGARPCLYKHEFTFGMDGSYTIDNKDLFWAEYGVFNNSGCDVNTVPESCMDVSSGTLQNECGDDVSAWLTGAYTFEYDVANGELTVNGDGAWIGIPKLGTTAETIVPVSSVTCNIALTEEVGYDLMTLTWVYGDITWSVIYVSYSDETLEPELVEEEAPFGTDLEDITPTEMMVTFASRDAADLVLLDTVASGSVIVFGADDPADAGAAKVGQFTRVEGVDYQELKFQTYPELYDIQFDNFTTATIEVYYPSSNDYSGTLTQSFVWGFADPSETEQWWTDIVQLENVDIPLDTWTTYTFDLTDAKARQDLDMFYIGMGGGGHSAGGTFYIRNLIFN
jgi:PKD repeat protein